MSFPDHDPTFDLVDNAAEIAEMQREQDHIDAEKREHVEPLAEALCLLVLADRVRTARFDALKRAESKLGLALDALLKARDELDAASDLEIEAMKTVLILRGGRPGDVHSALSQIGANQ